MASHLFKRMAGAAAIILPTAFFAVSPALAQDSGALSPTQQKEVDNRIENYLMSHPEVLLRAIRNVQSWQASEQARQQAEAIKPVWDKIMADDTLPSVGPAHAPVTVVEFFDYQCGYCKKAFGEMKDLVDNSKGKIRAIYIEFPILTPQSGTSARAALAAARQGKYIEAHRAFMGSRGVLTDDRIDEIAANAGIDVKQMRKDMDDSALGRALAENADMARAIGINGTPAFLINGKLVPGADMQRVEELVQDGLKKAS